MKSKTEYTEAEKKCIEALSSLSSNSDTITWLSNHSQLFDSVTYSVGDLPLLPDCNFDGQYFEGIGRFCKKYEQLLNGVAIRELLKP